MQRGRPATWPAPNLFFQTNISWCWREYSLYLPTPAHDLGWEKKKWVSWHGLEKSKYIMSSFTQLGKLLPARLKRYQHARTANVGANVTRQEVTSVNEGGSRSHRSLPGWEGPILRARAPEWHHFNVYPQCSCHCYFRISVIWRKSVKRGFR